ncbi:PHP domain-containing protein [Paenibacillus sp. Marseille-Q4541]|uniref:PHP domain-containing protein n=1 Tax=Paenibacillus sp. Marseille-Q4541 TaxID=2831522 RepID=UPI001BAA601A|nr:PHP domain-containing protein [Paenibacillus sp. Marseille-Q4541]
MKVELHCHTNLSDGSCSFTEVLELAAQEHISHLAITNHDTTVGLGEMVNQGKESGIEIIPGIEISAYDFVRNRRVHILGYEIEPGNKAIADLCDPLIQQRHEGCQRAVETLIQAGYDITWEQVMKYAEGGTGVYKQHIMHALIEEGYTDSFYGDLYKTLFSRGRDGETAGLAYTPMEYVDAERAITAIIAAGGVPVLAHPGQYESFEFVPELTSYGLQGIEMLHPLHGPQDEQRAARLAKEYNLFVTGGSDFHGSYGEKEVKLGSRSPGIDAVNAIRECKKSLHL